MQGGPLDQYGATAYAQPQGAQPQPPPPQPNPPKPYGAPPLMADRASSGMIGGDGRRALVGFLVSYQDDALGKFWPLWQGKNAIGRAETGQRVDVEIAHGTTSTHHATIECDGARFVLSDLGSTNGTFHNEEAIGFQGRRELRDGDKIRFGGYSVMVVNVVGRG
jgi:pSer/pThr/pTyr-binding forkhead associated (FHA) protein